MAALPLLSDDDEILSEYDESFGSDDDAPDALEIDTVIARQPAEAHALDEYIKRRISECDSFYKEMYHFSRRSGVIDAEELPERLKRKLPVTMPTIEEYDSIEQKCIQFALSQLNDRANDENIMLLDEVFKILSRIIHLLHNILRFPFHYYKDIHQPNDKEWTPNQFFGTYFKKLEQILEKLEYYNIIRSPYNLDHIKGEPDEPGRYDQFSEFKDASQYATSQAQKKAKAVVLATRESIVVGLNKELRKKYGNRYDARAYKSPVETFWYRDTQANQSLPENPILTQAKREIDEHEQILTLQLNPYIASLVKKAVVAPKRLSGWFFKVVFPDIPELKGVELVVPLSQDDWDNESKEKVKLRSHFTKNYPEIANPIFNGYSGSFGMKLLDGKSASYAKIPNGATVEIRYEPLKQWRRNENGIYILWPKGGKNTKSKSKKSKTKKSKTKKSKSKKSKTKKSKSKSKRNKRRSYKRVN